MCAHFCVKNIIKIIVVAADRTGRHEVTWLVDLKYYFECDWLIELSDNKSAND